MTVQLSDDVWWINESYDHGNTHEHVSVYLIQHNDQCIVVDTGSFYHREAITETIEEVTDGGGVDAIILSHSDYPHSGNIGAIQSEWNEVLLVASSGYPAGQGLPSSAIECTIGESLEVLGRTFSFIDPPLADRSHTTWIYDNDANVLFTADGFGSFHDEGRDDLTSADLEDGIPYDRIYEYHKDALVWLRYVDPAKIREALERIFDTYTINWIAPVHGHPIANDDMEAYLDRLVRAAAQISDEYDIPSDPPDSGFHYNG
jgi:flavorubredoxin